MTFFSDTNLDMKSLIQKHSQRGQILVVLLLIILVALTIGIILVQRSIGDVATSTQTEQSARAFSAAEAGVEKAVQQNLSQSVTPNLTVDLDNESRADVNAIRLPLAGAGKPLVYPPLGKDSIAQFWLVDPSATTIGTYAQNSVFVYFGNFGVSPEQTPAIEVNVIRVDGSGNYISDRFYYDPIQARRDGANGFPSNNFSQPTYSSPAPGGNCDVAPNSPDTFRLTAYALPTDDQSFRCKVQVTFPANTAVMVRTRLLYSTQTQVVALQPVTGTIPVQASLYLSTGRSGQSQRTLRVFRPDNFMIPFLDYALFSISDIEKVL